MRLETRGRRVAPSAVQFSIGAAHGSRLCSCVHRILTRLESLPAQRVRDECLKADVQRKLGRCKAKDMVERNGVSAPWRNCFLRHDPIPPLLKGIQ